MCGIVGYVGERQAVSVLLDGLKRLEYRGYDSAGLALGGLDGRLSVEKRAGRVENLAEAVAQGAVPLERFDDSWDDPAIVASLTSIKGIGVWTAEMFLIFSLNRPDVLPAHDLGVRTALRDRHGLANLPAPRECPALAEHWRPYRTIASWYIWRNVDTPIA